MSQTTTQTRIETAGPSETSEAHRTAADERGLGHQVAIANIGEFRKIIALRRKGSPRMEGSTSYGVGGYCYEILETPKITDHVARAKYHNRIMQAILATNKVFGEPVDRLEIYV